MPAPDHGSGAVPRCQRATDGAPSSTEFEERSINQVAGSGAELVGGALAAGVGHASTVQHQVRHWRSWYRWVTLAMLAYAFLVVAAVTEHAHHPPPLGLIPLTCNEIQHLFAALVADAGHRLR